jgi:hypothetical protein
MAERDKPYQWSVDAAAKILRSTVTTNPHPAFGKEHRLSVQDPQDSSKTVAQLLLYPQKSTVVYRDPHNYVSMGEVTYMGPDPERTGGVKAESITGEAVSTLGMNASGQVFFRCDRLVRAEPMYATHAESRTDELPSVASVVMKEQEPNKPTEHTPAPSGEGFSEELETDLLGLIGDMENDLSFADEAVHEGDVPTLYERLQSVVLEVSEAIHLLRREARQSDATTQPTS